MPSSRPLNKTWRGKDKATNVLSFPTEEPSLLGDIVVAYETTAREAAEEGKSLADHLSHLIVHGVLHLVGFDHEEDAEAEAMERLEGDVLATLGIASPYQDEEDRRAPAMTQIDHVAPSRPEAEDERSSVVGKPRLIDRMRAVFGLAGASIRDDIQDALEDTSAQTDFSAQERTMMKNVLALHELRVIDVMVPRADIYSVSLAMTLSEVLAMFRTAGHSRLPVYGSTLDDPRGMIHVRDYVDYLAAAEEPAPRPTTLAKVEGPEPEPGLMVRSLGALDLSLPLSAAKILRPVLFVPPSMPALDLLVKMQATRTHMALVIDEYGGTEGLASIEDIVELIVGDIEDEHDLDDAPSVVANDDGSYFVDARAALDDLSETLGTDFEAMSDAEDVETIGGLVTALAGHVPVRGEIVVEHGFDFEVLDADPRRVKRLKIYRSHPRDRPAEPVVKSA